MKTINEVDFLENQRFRKSTSRNWVVSNKITKVLNSVGFGWAQYRSIFVVGLAFLISSMDIVIVSILQNCVPMQWDTVSFKYNILTCSIFMGQILGLSFAGLLADNYGRKKCLLCGWGFKMLICFIPRYEESYVRVFMGRLLAGVAMGATQTIGYDLVAELLPTQKRGTALLILSICTSLGKFLITLICWVFLAEYGWSTVSFYTGVFILVPFVYGFFLLPESPLWLASKDKVEWAESVIDEMSSINGVQMEPVLIARATKKSTGIKPYRRLFGSKFRWRVANMSVVWFATSFAYICLIVQEGKTFQKGRYCNISYFEVVTLNAVELPGIIILYNLISKFPRGMIQSIFLGYSATFSVLRALTSMFTTTHSGNATLPEYVYLLAMKATLVAAIAALWIHTVELFPTEIRSTAHSFLLSVGSCATILGFLWAEHDENATATVTSFVIAGACILAAGCVLRTPDTCGRSLDAPTRPSKRNALELKDRGNGDHTPDLLTDEETKDPNGDPLRNSSFKAFRNPLIESVDISTPGKPKHSYRPATNYSRAHIFDPDLDEYEDAPLVSDAMGGRETDWSGSSAGATFYNKSRSKPNIFNDSQKHTNHNHGGLSSSSDEDIEVDRDAQSMTALRL